MMGSGEDCHPTNKYWRSQNYIVPENLFHWLSSTFPLLQKAQSCLLEEFPLYNSTDYKLLKAQFTPRKFYTAGCISPVNYLSMYIFMAAILVVIVQSDLLSTYMTEKVNPYVKAESF